MKQFLLLVSCLATVSVFAQVTSVSIEAYYVDDNSIAGYPDGHTTYRIYANCTNSNDVVSTCYGDVYAPMTFQVTGGTIWNTPLGGSTGPAINQGFCGIFPEICLDSFVTIGRENLASPGGTIFTLESGAQPWISNFAAGNVGTSFTLDDEVGGAWFGLPGDANCFPDANLKILLAQVTTAGEITVNLNLQVFPNWTGAGSDYIEQTNLFATTGLVPGCTDPVACNYNPNANQDDGSCDYSCLGCTDPMACNFDAGATQDDGSCDYSCIGCMDPAACNYSMTATIDDGSCTYPGCMDMMACNYDATAGCDDGSCDFSCNGCTDMTACNYSPSATIDDGSCDYSCYGCTTAGALNFDAGATIDDGSCLFPCMLMATSSGSTSPTCAYNSDGSISISLSGAQGNYMWSVNGGALQNLGNSETFTGLANGNYQIVIRDDRFDDLSIDPDNAFGECTVTLNFTLNTEGVTFCENTVSSATCSYSWDGCAEDLCWSGTEGNYVFTIIDAMDDMPFMDENGDIVSLSVPSYCGLPEGMYYWAATDANNCTYTSDNFEISAPEALGFCSTTTEAVTCNGAADGCATAECVDGGVAPYVISLYDANTDMMVAGDLSEAAYCGLSGGDYYWLVQDANGCEAVSETFTVSEPEAITFCETTVTDVTCFGGNDGCISTACVSGGTGEVICELIDASTDLNVLDGDGNPVMLSSPDYCGLMAGSYYWVATDENGCMAESEVYMVGEPESIMITVATSAVSCNGGNDGSFTIIASGGTGSLTCSYEGIIDEDCTWTDLPAGSYVIVVTDEAGCMAEFEVQITEPESLMVSAEAEAVLCYNNENGTVTLTASGGTAPYTYVLDGAEQDNGNFDGLPAGDYDYTVTDANGCEVSGTVSIDNAEELNITVDSNGGDGGNNEGFINTTVTGGTGDYTYSWTDADGDEVGTTEDITGLGAGDYTLCVTDENGCELCLDEAVTITVGIAESNMEFSVSVNPNPTTGAFNLQIEGMNAGTAEMLVFDLAGKKVFSSKLTVHAAKTSIPMDFSHLSAGVYQLNLIQGTANTNVKLVIE